MAEAQHAYHQVSVADVVFNMQSLTIKLALQMWCLISPPPKMIMPVFTALTARLFTLRISGKNTHKYTKYY